jgi:hypothetical protein
VAVRWISRELVLAAVFSGGRRHDLVKKVLIASAR